MDTDAVAQAKLRLGKAEKALAAMKSATALDDMEEFWTDFLIATAAIYSKLEQGSKQNPKSEGWYARKKSERRKDPLLRYLHYARNSNEHGIERVVRSTGDNNHPFEGRKMRVNERFATTVQQVDPVTKVTFGAIATGTFAGPTLKPIRAHDRRFNDHCDPPEEHRGTLIDLPDFADSLGGAALPYLREMIGEAEGLAAGSSNTIAK
jgi:hypothetical protein